MHDGVHGAGDVERLADVATGEGEPRATLQPGQVHPRAGGETVEGDHLVAAADQQLTDVGAEEARASTDDDSHRVADSES